MSFKKYVHTAVILCMDGAMWKLLIDIVPLDCVKGEWSDILKICVELTLNIKNLLYSFRRTVSIKQQCIPIYF